VTRRRSRKITTYALIASAALVAALAFAQPGIAALAAPFAAALVLGLATSRGVAPRLVGQITAEPAEILEGDRLTLRLAIESLDLDGRCDVALALPAGLVLVSGALRRAVTLRSSGTAELEVLVDVARWGDYTLGPIAVRAREPGGLFVWEGTVGEPVRFRARPTRQAAREVVRAHSVAPATGEHASKHRADGIEFADLRRYTHGDRAGQINWRVSARRGDLYVNDHYPDRCTDVVLFIDTFSEIGLAETVRIASALADSYLRRHDRVGMISFGGVLSWLEPGGGPAQRARLDEALLGAASYASYAWKSLDVIPARTLPARCLVVAVSPLVDERVRVALATMAARRLDVAVLEVPLRPGEQLARSWSGRVALRLDAMQRQAAREQFLGLGVSVVAWTPETGIEGAVREIEIYRRRARVRVHR
jgi:uncharacterized protein (DUF58 family)